MVQFLRAGSGFTLDEEEIGLPTGAWAKTRRRLLRWQGREILGFTQGRFRPYLYPVFSPRGFALTSESPADHPHHNSIWVGCDHVHCLVPAAGGAQEEYTYNLYVDETFQGRAAGVMAETDFVAQVLSSRRVRVDQIVAWRGPPEWGAPQGRPLASERRETTVAVDERFFVIDIRSEVSPADWDLALGPTRHAYFNVRVAESMKTAAGGALLDAEGSDGAGAIIRSDSAWVDFSGPVGGGHVAGVCVMPYPASAPRGWFVADWGVVTVGPFRRRRTVLRPGESAVLACRLVSYLSEAMTLLPGDVIITGTPAGVGPLGPGDLIEIEIEISGIGVLRNRVVAET